MPTAPDPRLPGRYASTDKGGATYLWCQDHPEAPLATVRPLGPQRLIGEREADAIGDAIRTHDEQHHEGDEVV
jgi:hypothetical protein